MSAKMRHAVANDISLENDICYITELISEQHSSKQNGEYTLHIPSFILLHMLEFSASNMLTHREQKQLLLILSSWSLVKSSKSYMSLCMIKTLGICQQITGYLQCPVLLPAITKIPSPENSNCIRQRIRDLIKKKMRN